MLSPFNRVMLNFKRTILTLVHSSLNHIRVIAFDKIWMRAKGCSFDANEVLPSTLPFCAKILKGEHDLLNQTIGKRIDTGTWSKKLSSSSQHEYIWAQATAAVEETIANSKNVPRRKKINRQHSFFSTTLTVAAADRVARVRVHISSIHPFPFFYFYVLTDRTGNII